MYLLYSTTSKEGTGTHIRQKRAIISALHSYADIMQVIYEQLLQFTIIKMAQLSLMRMLLVLLVFRANMSRHSYFHVIPLHFPLLLKPTDFNNLPLQQCHLFPMNLKSCIQIQ